MSVSANYPTPVYVNGFQCRNCTDVAYAQKHIDPAHPKSGPFGINAKDDPTVKNNQVVSFGGALVNLNVAEADTSNGVGRPTGTRLDVSA